MMEAIAVGIVSVAIIIAVWIGIEHEDIEKEGPTTYSPGP